MWISVGDPKGTRHYQGDLVAAAADANLIIAAPDLYAALARLTYECGTYDNGRQVLQVGPMMEPSEQAVLNARAALAKAHGVQV